MKLTIVVAAALVLLSAGACRRTQKRVVGVIPKGSTHLFWQSVHAGANKAARELGVEVSWNGPATETDFNQQLQILDSMINRRVDAIAIAPIDRQSTVGAVERAAAANIPVIIFDSGLNTAKFVAQVATDNFRAGELAAERMGTILGGTGEVAMVQDQPGAGSTMARDEGFEKKLRADYPGIRIVARQFGRGDFAKSLAVAENMLTAHPELDGMFACNESSTVGAAKALESRKSAVKLVGFDFSPKLLDDVKSGLVDSLVCQDPFRMGYDSVRAAVARLNGQPVARIQNIAPQLVDRNNLADADVRARVFPDLKKYLD